MVKEKKKMSLSMLMNSGNEILGGGGLRALLLLAAFCRVKWNRSNMLTDVDMPVALATSTPSLWLLPARQHLAPAPSVVLTAASASTFLPCI